MTSYPSGEIDSGRRTATYKPALPLALLDMCARQSDARGRGAMLDQVEVTVAEQPLRRLQAVGSAQAVFPFLCELSWGTRESFSPARHAATGPADPPSICFPARVMNSCGSAR